MLTKKPISWKEIFEVVLLLYTFGNVLQNQVLQCLWTIYLCYGVSIQLILTIRQSWHSFETWIIICQFIMLIINLYTCILHIMVQLTLSADYNLVGSEISIQWPTNDLSWAWLYENVQKVVLNVVQVNPIFRSNQFWAKSIVWRKSGSLERF